MKLSTIFISATILIASAIIVMGLFGLRMHPSTQYMPGWVKNIDFPEEFEGVISETGEINSPMRFTRSGDTLRVEFIQE